MLCKNPGFTTIALLTLAIGIGANAAIFSFVHAVLLKPLPYLDSEQLVMVFENHRTNGWEKAYVGAPVLGEWRRQSSVFQGLAARGWRSFSLSGDGPPETLNGAQFSANIFSLLRLHPILGRDFLPEEEVPGKHRVALISEGLWQRRFGRDPKVIGRTIRLNLEPYVIVGVMPARDAFPDPKVEIWVPLSFGPGEMGSRHAHN
jgi:putative ABC transport system permease protein